MDFPAQLIPQESHPFQQSRIKDKESSLTYFQINKIFTALHQFDCLFLCQYYASNYEREDGKIQRPNLLSFNQ